MRNVFRRESYPHGFLPSYEERRENVLGKECVLVVNISSIKPDTPHDNTCVLGEGDHPFLVGREKS